MNRQGGASIYGGTKAFLDRVVTGAASELYDDNIAVNNLGPTGAVATPLSTTVAGVPPGGTEPMETMVEAALALVTGNPQELTSRIVYSLPLLVELNRPVYTVDGKQMVEGWQPHEIPKEMLRAGYLSGH
jgi:NAD(P)-dependent dehydrogenase (short-subunit alcohol dehydrogenase family)